MFIEFGHADSEYKPNIRSLKSDFNKEDERRTAGSVGHENKQDDTYLSK